MIGDLRSEQDGKLLLAALTTFGDACCLPSLTPECPYYRQDSKGVPTCNNECRTLLEWWGFHDRAIRDVRMDGLVLRGRGIPISAAVGSVPFDARQKYLEDRHKPVISQSSTSLLLGLAAHLKRLPLTPEPKTLEPKQTTWIELKRRGFPVERLVQACLLPSLVPLVLRVAAAQHLQKSGLFPDHASREFLAQLLAFSNGGWGKTLDDAFDSEGDPGQAVQRARSTSMAYIRDSNYDLLTPAPDQTIHLRKWDLSDPHHQRLFYCLSGRFASRVAEWMILLLMKHRDSFSPWIVPPGPLFSALPDRPPPPDEFGRWIWERFTTTDLSDWHPVSLLREWRVANNLEERPLPGRTWAERPLGNEYIAEQALLKLSTEHADSTPQTCQPVGAPAFNSKAIELLRTGKNTEAAEIFSCLVALEPANGEFLNNLGFCLIPSAPGDALEYLQQASLRRGTVSQNINMVNRVLALHLVGRNGDALALCREALHEMPSESDPSTQNQIILWRHTACDEPFEIEETTDAPGYLRSLENHLLDMQNTNRKSRR